MLPLLLPPLPLLLLLPLLAAVRVEVVVVGAAIFTNPLLIFNPKPPIPPFAFR